MNAQGPSLTEGGLLLVGPGLPLQRSLGEAPILRGKRPLMPA